MSVSQRHVWAIFLVFFTQSAVLGSWIPRIPDIKESLGISSFTLGLCLLALSAGTMTAFVVAGRFCERFGLRRTLQLALPGWAILFIFPALAPSAFMLLLALLFCGAAVGLCEVAMNTLADEIEGGWHTRIMSRCHGFWSLGSLFGAATGALFAHFHVVPAVHFLWVMPFFAIAGYFVATALPRSDVRLNQQPAQNLHRTVDVEAAALATVDTAASVFRVPRKEILLLCIMPVGIMCVEGAFIDWSAIFMRTVLDSSALVIGATYTFFSLVMAATRMFGDSIVERFGELNVARWSAFAATAGIALFASSSNVMMAFAGAALAGLGVAIVYPLAMTAAASREGNASDNVASVALISFSAFLLAPPIIGFIADWLSLRWALALLIPVAATTWFLSGEIVRRK